ncbi:unnamed protein product [Darwinula stevensoni]|uniref:Uncharacterized protein n=1 Tax=Darwinula stevensoni TaxID=69355 RepID=A0A7R8XCR8_9CRUS|nr:unnamed protein product [Darwinula stevensoni]CAG0892469.1 unnamed protein product [Darwinula stevensoni]
MQKSQIPGMRNHNPHTTKSEGQWAVVNNQEMLQHNFSLKKVFGSPNQSRSWRCHAVATSRPQGHVNI